MHPQALEGARGRCPAPIEDESTLPGCARLLSQCGLKIPPLESNDGLLALLARGDVSGSVAFEELLSFYLRFIRRDFGSLGIFGHGLLVLSFILL